MYSTRGLLQRWTESSIILTVKRRISLEEPKAQKQDRFFRGRQIAHLIYEYFRITGANDSVENYADLFTISLRNDDTQEFDSKWDGNFIVNDENPIWWHLGRTVQIKNTRVWETQDRIGIVWPGDSSEEVRDLIITDWKPWWKEVSSKIYETVIFGIWNGNYERNAVVKNQGTK